MNHLSENLLALARGDDRAAPRSTGTVDLAGLIRGVVAEMEPLFLEKQLTVELALESRPILPAADADGIRRLIAALIDNARKYTPAGGGVRVSLHDDATEAVLEVSDTGYGIPDEALTRIFDRFYRIDPSRDRETGGHGLGLAIAQQIARFHHGQVEASNVPGSGATFRFRVPKNGAEH